MLVGVATRQYERSLVPLGADVRYHGTSKSAVCRCFVTVRPQAQLDAWRATSLEDLDLAALLIDGVHVGGHCIVAALGVDFTGAKHPLGLWEGSTENTTVCQGLLTNVQRCQVHKRREVSRASTRGATAVASERSSPVPMPVLT